MDIRKFTVVAGLLVVFSQSCLMALAENNRAQDIPNQNESFQLHASEYSLKVQAAMTDAQKLQGKAGTMEQAIKLHMQKGRLSGAKLTAAVRQFESDLKDFKLHAAEYAAHVNQVRKQIGDSHRNQAEYNPTVVALKLPTEISQTPATVQVPESIQVPATVQTPEIVLRPEVPTPCQCSQTGLSLEASHAIADRMLANRSNNLVPTDVDLRLQKVKLMYVQADNLRVQGRVLEAADRADAERSLVGEFGRLKQEFELLKTEKESIYGSIHGSTQAVAAASVKSLIRK